MSARMSMALAVAMVVLGACSSPSENSVPDTTLAAEVEGTVLRLVIPDGNIRPEGVECAGARPYRQIRAGVPFEVVSGDEVLVSGELPPGRAENADPSIDWEELARIPTVCIMELAVGELPEHDGYELRVDGAGNLSFTADDVAVGTPIVLIAEN